MKKRLLMIAALAMAVGTSFAQEIGSYAYTATQRVKITGENLVTNGDFSQGKEGWTNAAGEELNADVWDYGEGEGPGGENVLKSLNSGTADAALCRAWALPTGSYVVQYDISGGEATDATGIVNGNTRCADFFLTSGDALTKADDDIQVATVNGFKNEWKTVRYFFTADESQKLVMHFEKLNANVMVTNIKIFPAVIVFDDRIIKSKLDYVDKLLATGKFILDTENGFVNNVVGTLREMLNGSEEGVLDDPSEVEAIMEAYEEELQKWYALNAADLLKDEKRWSTLGDTRKQNGMNEGKEGYNWKGTGGRWFHKNNDGSNEITDDGDEIGHRFQGGSEGNASQYYTITPSFAGTYMFSLDIVGHYMAGSSGKSYTYLSGTTDNYVTDWNRDFKGVTIYAGKDIMGADAEANATMNNEQEGQKIDCGVISNPNAKNNPQKFVVFYEVSQDMVDAQTPVTFGITYILDPDRVAKLGSNVNIANPQIRLIGVTQDIIDYENEVKKIIVQQGPLKERLQWANDDLQKTAADGYPYGKAALKHVTDSIQPIYDASLLVVDAEGQVLNAQAIKDLIVASAAGEGILYSDSLLNAVKTMNSARNAFSNANKLASTTYPQKVADAEAVYTDAFYGAGDKETFRTAIDAAIAKRIELLATANDDNKEEVDALMNTELETLATATEVFKASANNVPFVDIDFSNKAETNDEQVTYIKGAAGQMEFVGAYDVNNSGVVYTLGHGEEKMDMLRVGSGDAVVNIDETNQASDDEILRVAFDLYVGNLSGQFVGVQLQNIDGQRIAGFRLNRYNGQVEYNDFNSEDNSGLDILTYVTGVGSSSASNVAIAADNNCSSFTLIIDNKAKTVQGMVANPQKGTCIGAAIPMRTDIEDVKIAKFVLNSNYNNADRRCWFDNLKMFKYASQAEGPTTGIAGVKAAVKADSAIYNLAGQKVDKSYKGIVIMNGKKVVLK